MRTRIAVTLAALTFAAPLLGQTARTADRRGFWIGFGLGAGSNLSENLVGARGGGAFYLRLGGSVNQQLLIGGEALSWARQQNSTTTSQGNAAAVVYFYPSASGGLFLKSGLGVANRIASTAIGNTTISTSDAGFGATFGGGVDIQLGANFFITPNLDFLVQTIEGTTGGLLLVTVGATWH